MKGKYLAIVIVAALAVGAVIWYLRRRKATVKTGTDGAVCVAVPGTMKKWTGDFSAMDNIWDSAREEYLGQDPADGNLGARTAGFFKALGVEPRGQYIPYYKDAIKNRLNSVHARPHWEVEEGELACLN